MTQKTRTLSPIKNSEDSKPEVIIRPQVLDEMIGQERVKENLGILIQAAAGRNEALDHVLLYGPPGLGKTTMAHIIANDLNSYPMCQSTIIANLNNPYASIEIRLHRDFSTPFDSVEKPSWLNSHKKRYNGRKAFQSRRCCSGGNSMGRFKCSNAALVAIRPREVRSRNPNCSK